MAVCISMEQDSTQDEKSLHSANLLTAALAQWQEDPDIKSTELLQMSPHFCLANLIYFFTWLSFSGIMRRDS